MTILNEISIIVLINLIIFIYIVYLYFKIKKEVNNMFKNKPPSYKELYDYICNGKINNK